MDNVAHCDRFAHCAHIYIKTALGFWHVGNCLLLMFPHLDVVMGRVVAVEGLALLMGPTVPCTSDENVCMQIACK